MVPAQQCLESEDAAAGQVGAGLVLQLELPALDCVTQTVDQCKPLADCQRDLLGENLEIVAALAFLPRT
jgi:hypothetical protein